MGTSYSIGDFARDARAILRSASDLHDQQEAIGEQLSELSNRDDLTRFGLPLGPSDASTGNYLLWREPPHSALVLGQFDPGYLSPVHEHGEHWVVGCGYAGEDRWDMYERQDDRLAPGHAEVVLVDQWSLPRGRSVVMPKPPRSIHSHNNVFNGNTLELIFSAVPPLASEDRLIYDVENGQSWSSPFNLSGVLVGSHYPPRPSETLGQPKRDGGDRRRVFAQTLEAAACGLCRTFQARRRNRHSEP